MSAEHAEKGRSRSQPAGSHRSRSRRPARALILAAGATAGAAALGVAAERYAVRRARTRPDPDRGEPLDELPGEELRVRSFDGTQLAVNATGPDHPPTLAFVHGFSGDMTLWHFQWKRFSGGYRCVLYDQRGHGRSGPAAESDYTLEALGRDLKAVLDREAPEGPVVLIGHSMGGMSILSFAALFPQEFGGRVAAVVLANTAAADLLKEILATMGVRATRLVATVARRITSDPRRVYRIRARALAGKGDLAFLFARATNFGPNAPPSVVEHVARIGSRAPVEVWTDLLTSLMDMDLAHALEHVTVPTLIVAGDVDRLTPPATAAAMRRKLPDSRLVVLEGAGHCAMLERHAEFNRTMEGFLRDVLYPAQARTTA